MYEYFEHQADVGIIGKGKNLEEAFQEAAKALFEIMCDIKSVEAKTSVKIAVQASDEGALLIEWMNALLAQKDIHEMMFSKFKVKIKDNSLTGEAIGEKVKEEHHLKIEVKAATYSQLSVKKEGKTYVVRCVVDV